MEKKLKILVFGNALVEEDSIALRLAKKLQKEFMEVEFKEFDTSENLEKEGRNLIILDAALGLEKIVLLDGIEQLSETKIYSMHDFDLPITLKMLKKMKMLDSVRIIAIPANSTLKKALNEVRSIISSLLLRSE